MVVTKEGYDMSGQCILFGGKQLQQELTIGDYNIESESRLHMISNLLGGGVEGSGPFLHQKNIEMQGITGQGFMTEHKGIGETVHYILKHCYDTENPLRFKLDFSSLLVGLHHITKINGCGKDAQ